MLSKSRSPLRMGMNRKGLHSGFSRRYPTDRVLKLAYLCAACSLGD